MSKVAVIAVTIMYIFHISNHVDRRYLKPLNILWFIFILAVDILSRQCVSEYGAVIQTQLFFLEHKNMTYSQQKRNSGKTTKRDCFTTTNLLHFRSSLFQIQWQNVISFRKQMSTIIIYNYGSLRIQGWHDFCKNLILYHPQHKTQLASDTIKEHWLLR